MYMRGALTPVSGRHSLRWRLPALVSGLVALVVVVFLWAAHRRIEAALVHSAGERAQREASHVATALGIRYTGARLRRLGADGDLRQLLETRDPDAEARLHARLSRMLRSSVRRIEIWDRAGSRLLDAVAPIDASDESSRTVPRGAPPATVGVGPIQAADGLVFADLIAEVRADGTVTLVAESDDGLGYIRARLVFVESRPGIFSRPVGPDVRIRLGNRTGGTWTDLERPLSHADVDLSRPGVTQHLDESGTVRLGAVALIEDTPWAVWVGFSRSEVVAPARIFLQEMTVIGLVLVTVAAAFATALAARITTPLTELGAAAAAIAGGDYSRRVRALRRDEIGRLGRIFNAMAADVEATSSALRKSEHSYRRLFASNPHPMWVYDAETLRFLHVNDMAIAQYGYSRDEFLAMTIKDIRPMSEVAPLLDNLGQPATDVERCRIWKHRRKDGTLIDVEVSSHGLMVDGRPARVVLANDVTERQQALNALKERESLFRGMAETIPHIVWMARPDGTIEYVNRLGLEYLGLAFDEACNGGLQAAVHPDDREPTLSCRDEAIRAEVPYKVTYRLRRRADGVYRWHLGRAAPLRNEQGDVILWVGTVTDIDDQLRMTEALKSLNGELERRVRARTKELEEANRELEAFSYSVSHDLRAPLRHVQGYIEMFIAASEGGLSEKSRRYLQTIADATVDMGKLIDGLLALSRVGRLQLSEERVSLEMLVRSSVAAVESAMRGRDIVWTIGSLPDVVGDASLLKQVYANVIGNAVKYSRLRNPARIEIGCAGQDADGRAILFVRDNGAGFDMRYAHKLFGAFQRLHPPDEFEGTGIGLATVRRIVSRHGGRTWAEGKPGEGATIYFTLQPAPVRPEGPEIDVRASSTTLS